MIARLPLIALAATLAACTHLATAEPPEATDAMPDMAGMPGPDEGVFPSMMRQTAEILGKDGGAIGTANFLSGPNGMMIRVEIVPGGLTPGWHGMHIHAVGDCSDTGTYTLSGGHVGKHDGGHGLLNPKGPEAGDLPNIWAAADGSAGYEAFSTIGRAHV